MIFHDVQMLLKVVSQMTVKLVKEFGVTSLQKNSRSVEMASLDLRIPWGFFNGASQGHPSLGKAPIVLYLSPSHYFHLKCIGNTGTNNKSKFFALWLLLTSTKQNVVKSYR